MAKKPFPFSACELCCNTSGGGGSADLSDYVTKEELEAKGYSKNRIYRLEGYLYPDTYYFYEDDNAVQVINKFLNNTNE